MLLKLFYTAFSHERIYILTFIIAHESCSRRRRSSCFWLSSTHRIVYYLQWIIIMISELRFSVFFSRDRTYCEEVNKVITKLKSAVQHVTSFLWLTPSWRAFLHWHDLVEYPDLSAAKNSALWRLENLPWRFFGQYWIYRFYTSRPLFTLLCRIYWLHLNWI